MRTFKIVMDGCYNCKILLLDKDEQTPWCKKPGNDVIVNVLIGCISIEGEACAIVNNLKTGQTEYVYKQTPWQIVAKELSVIKITLN